MKALDKTKILRIIVNSVSFVALAALCVWLYPRHMYSFKYNYEVGKPWGYEQLITDEAFPIYKTEAQMLQEQAEVLNTYTPYYTINEQVADTILAAIMQIPEAQSISTIGTRYLREAVTHVYQQGVLSATDYDQLVGVNRISILTTNRIAHTQEIDVCYTPRSAYAYIVDNAPLITGNRLRSLNLDKYIIPNLTFNAETSTKVRNELLATIAPTQGMVDKGVKVVDRGEIITEETAQILYSMSMAYNNKQVDQKQYILSIIGNSCLVLTFILLFVMYLAVDRRSVLQQPKAVFFFILLIALMITLTWVVLTYTKLSIYIIPFAWVPILVRVFFDSRTAFQAHLLTILLATFMVPNSFEFMLVQLVTGLVVISSLQEMTARGQLVRTAGLYIPTAAFTYTVFTLAVSGDWAMLDWRVYIYILVNALLITFAYGLVFFAEKGFGFLSAITLVELTNANNNLLMEFAGKAPGTFQHSLQVSDLATEAARQIGANALLVRTGALYHDIGKMAAPQNFIENQSEGENPLQDLSYEEAAQVIIAHVEEGVKIAKKHKLPDIIIHFIQTHHGTSKTRYFYNSYMNAHPDEKVDESLFTYPGPRPSTKEGVVLMMADAVEARSRSMNEMTEESIEQMIEQMIGAQIADGQYKDTVLSFKDVEVIKEVFKEKLININHHRIVYPEVKA